MAAILPTYKDMRIGVTTVEKHHLLAIHRLEAQIDRYTLCLLKPDPHIVIITLPKLKVIYINFGGVVR